MANSEYMILAKDVDYKRLINTHCALCEKIDGVPGIFGRTKITMSRQGKPISSVKHLEEVIDRHLPKGVQIIGELHVPGEPFKVSSGKVRGLRQCPDIVLGVWDVVFNNLPDLPYNLRFIYGADILSKLSVESGGKIFQVPVKYTFGATPEHYERAVLGFYEDLRLNFKRRMAEFKPGSALSCVGEPEGVIIRPAGESYRTGRSWGLQRYVPKPTADLRVIGFYEATANKDMAFLGDMYVKGEGMRAIGALIVKFHGEDVKVGPGALTHKERRAFYENPSLILDKIIKVKYKKDPTYEALREPTFVEIRHDKTIADDEEPING